MAAIPRESSGMRLLNGPVIRILGHSKDIVVGLCIHLSEDLHPRVTSPNIEKGNSPWVPKVMGHMGQLKTKHRGAVQIFPKRTRKWPRPSQAKGLKLDPNHQADREICGGNLLTNPRTRNTYMGCQFFEGACFFGWFQRGTPVWVCEPQKKKSLL